MTGALLPLARRILKISTTGRDIKCLKNTSSRLFSFTNAHRKDLGAIKDEMMKYEGGSVDLHKDEETGIAVMTINNTQTRNALTGKMMVDMAEAVERLEGWSSGRGLLLCGAEGTFCSGGDLNFVVKSFDKGDEMATLMHDTTSRLHSLPLVSVALIQGYALGGGGELATACDFRVASAKARLGFVQLSMGVTTGWGAGTRLTRLVGRQAALRLLTSAHVLKPIEASELGLVDLILPDGISKEDEVRECKDWLLKNFCRHESSLTQAAKSIVAYASENSDLAASLKHEREVFTRFWGGPSQIEILKSKSRL